MNHCLLSKFMEEEILAIVLGMTQTTATRDDGMLAFFFQKFWYIVGHKVSSFWLGILNEGNSFDETNMMNTVLIPKK